MPSTSRLLILAAAAAFALSAHPPAAEARTKIACERLSGKDLAPAPRLKVVKEEDDDGAVRVLACTLRGGKVRTIASYTPDGEFASGDIDVVATGDRHALMRTVSAERGSARRLIRVETRTYRRHTIATEVCDPFQYCTGQTATASAMHGSGALAAVVQDYPPCCTAPPVPGTPRLVRLASDGRRTILDEGAEITGLRVEGDEFVWLRAGQPQRAPVTAR